MSGAEPKREQPYEPGRFSAGVILALLILAALLLRWRVGLYQPPSFDGCGYIMHAKSIAAGKLTTIYWARGVDHYYQPLYPFLVSVFHLAISNWDKAASLANYFLGALLLIPFYLFGNKIYGGLGGIFSAALLVSYPGLVALSSNPSSEPAFLLAFGFGIYFFHCAVEEKKLGKAMLAGACFGISYLARSQAIIFLPISALCLLWLVLGKKLSLGHAAQYLLLLVVSFYIFALPYDLYCVRKDGSYGLRARQEFLKKVAEPQTMEYYVAERSLDPDATMLANFRAALNSTPARYMLSNPGAYLHQTKIEFLHSSKEMVREGFIINPLILALLLLALVAVVWKNSPNNGIKKFSPYLIWIIFFIVIPPLTAPAPWRYYAGLAPLFALFGAGGLLFLFESCRATKHLAWLGSPTGHGLMDSGRAFVLPARESPAPRLQGCHGRKI